MVCFLVAFFLFWFEYQGLSLVRKIVGHSKSHQLLGQQLCGSNKRAHRRALSPTNDERFGFDQFYPLLKKIVLQIALFAKQSGTEKNDDAVC